MNNKSPIGLLFKIRFSFVVFILFMFAVVLTVRGVSADIIEHTTVAHLSNIRVYRTPKFWTVVGDLVTARVRVVKVVNKSEAQHITLKVLLNSGSAKIIRVNSIHGVVIQSPTSYVFGLRHLTVDFQAPYVCAVDKPRDPVVLHVSVEHDNTITIDSILIDQKCLLGDLTDRIEATWLASLASKYANDPVIDEIIDDFASVPVGSPRQEVHRLNYWMKSRGIRWLDDPPDFTSNWAGDAAFILSPSETVWLGGGDCEDVSLLESAFLVRRGLRAWIATTVGHVWVRAARGTVAPVDVDLAFPGEQVAPASIGALPFPFVSSAVKWNIMFPFHLRLTLHNNNK